jgi:hypothetical protein
MILKIMRIEGEISTLNCFICKYFGDDENFLNWSPFIDFMVSRTHSEVQSFDRSESVRYFRYFIFWDVSSEQKSDQFQIEELQHQPVTSSNSLHKRKKRLFERLKWEITRDTRVSAVIRSNSKSSSDTTSYDPIWNSVCKWDEQSRRIRAANNVWLSCDD